MYTPPLKFENLKVAAIAGNEQKKEFKSHLIDSN